MSRFEGVKPLGKPPTAPFSARESEMFPWGRVLAVHKVGDHEVIEYLERKSDGGSITNDLSDKKSFHVNGASRSTPTLDAALVEAIAVKHDGINTQAGTLFCRALGVGL